MRGPLTALFTVAQTPGLVLQPGPARALGNDGEGEFQSLMKATETRSKHTRKGGKKRPTAGSQA